MFIGYGGECYKKERLDVEWESHSNNELLFNDLKSGFVPPPSQSSHRSSPSQQADAVGYQWERMFLGETCIRGSWMQKHSIVC